MCVQLHEHAEAPPTIKEEDEWFAHNPTSNNNNNNTDSQPASNPPETVPSPPHPLDEDLMEMSHGRTVSIDKGWREVDRGASKSPGPGEEDDVISAGHGMVRAALAVLMLIFAQSGLQTATRSLGTGVIRGER